VAAVPSSYGPSLKALVVYLIVYQHVPVERCVRLIADLTGGAAPSTGFVHGLLARCAAVLGEVVTLIKTAVTLAAVAGFDETVIRCCPARPRPRSPTTWAGGIWARLPRSGFSRRLLASRCTTGTRATSTRTGRS
jgi:hypothetical protein